MALVLRAAPAAGCTALSRAPAGRKAVVMRAREMREYREDTGEVTVAGEEKKALYADQVPAMARRKENLSKEMKARLRKEYVGLGGTADTPMSNNYFLWIIGIISVLAVMSKAIGAI